MPSQSDLKAHLFGVTSSQGANKLSNVLNLINANTLKNRVVPINGRRYRLERLEKGSIINTNANHLYLFNVMHFREGHGPGQAGLNQALTGLSYSAGEPGEDTAVLYDPIRSCMIIQYNHNGPRNTAIQNYLSEFCNNGVYSLNVKIDTSFAQKFQGQQHVTRVEATIDVAQVSRKDFNGNVPMLKAFEAAENLNGAKINISISVDGRQKGNYLNNSVISCLNHLMNLSRNKADALTKLESKGPVGLGDVEVLDLLGGKITGELAVPVSTTDYRMAIEDRWEVLYRMYLGWDSDGLI